ncbi:MAG: C69 family dipeptidase [Rikenellaceae bacterium]|nr:C69 family dipeptidase [Rikenellaceae bacterium]MDE7355595.1 C69 family dipeptidase [Rikenellaceae bacterium]
MRKGLISLAAAITAMLLPASFADACTNIIVTKGASKDGSVMVTYSADSHVLYGELYRTPAANHAPGTMLKIYEWDTGRYMGQIAQVPHTYSTIGNMNEHQLIITETTFGGLPQLRDKDGIMDYGSLIYITLQRAKTAREAIKVMTDLVAEYGYGSSGESFSIADKNEAWILELIGKGSKVVDGVNVNKGAVWVAIRIPDGYISSHANQARIRQFPLNDPENCIYSPDVISFAKSQKLYKGKDENFSFADTYNPLDFSGMRGCEARVWSAFNRFADGMDQYIEYAMGHNTEKRMPLYVKPKEKVSVKELADMMRDHYEDTPMDMRYDIGAGGHHLPYRWRPMTFKHEGVEYVNERAIATQQTGFWLLGQARSWLPDEVGGILWFGVDDAATSCLTPIYTSSLDVPECLREGNGNLITYSPTAAFWIFSRVANAAYLRYDLISKDIQKVIDRRENQAIAEIPAIDKAAVELMSVSPEAARRFLTDYSINKAQSMFNEWVELDNYLLVKYIDGNVKKEGPDGFLSNKYNPTRAANPDQPGYNEKWKKAVAEDAGETLKVHPVK